MSTIRITIMTLLLLFVATLPTRALAPSDATQFSCTNVTEIPQSECEALVDLYNSTDGPNWVQKEGWLITAMPCSWYGVTCSDGAVTVLDLDNDNDGNGLSGTIPATIANFTNLISLDISQNQLSSIPAEIGNLSNLTSLDLWGNQLSSVPAEIGNLSNLNYLYLSSNQLSSVPAEIGSLSNLSLLFLDSNELSSVPAEIGNLSNLEMLYLSSNQLSSVPAEIGNLSLLWRFDLDYNRIMVTDPMLLAFLDAKDPGWQDTQTVAPTNIEAAVLSDNSIQLSWRPIAFTEKGGSYEISTATTGSFVVHGATPDKSSNSYIVTDLLPGTTYFFRIRAYTPPHDGSRSNDSIVISHNQPNELWSEYSATIIAETTGQTPVPDTPTPTLTPTFILTPPPTPPLIQMFTPIPDATATSMPTFTPQPTATPSFTPTPVGAYEPNDSCNMAQEIITGDMAQEHAFQDLGDVDWIKFDVNEGITYRIEVIVPAKSQADVNLELYPDCRSTAEGQWLESFSPSVRMDFLAPANGTVHLKLLNDQAGLFGAAVSYQLSVRALSDDKNNRALIIVAGRLEERDRLQANIHHVTDQVYTTFQDYGYTNQNIKYLANSPAPEASNGVADLHNLELAITDWAAEQLTAGGVLNLYMMDHGNVDKLYIDGVRNQVLRPEMLDGWLTQLENQIDDLTINVIIEACQAGSFISPEGGTISGPGRLVITSTDDIHDAYASDEGAQFSDQFMAWLHRGYNVAASFTQARDTASEVFFLQDAWVDGDGDGKPNEFEDIAIASQRGFNLAGAFTDGDNWPPHIFQVAPPSITASRGTLYADVRDDENVDSVWAVIYLPSYTPPETGNQLQPEQSGKVDKIILDPQPDGAGLPDVVDGNRYGGSYNFVEAGDYRVIIYAEDRQGLNARPMGIEFTVVGGPVFTVALNKLYLPVITR